MPKWLRYALGFVVLLVAALLVNRFIQHLRRPDVSKTDDGMTHVRPHRPLLPTETWTFADTSGATERFRTNRPANDGVAIRVDSAGVEPVRLIVEIEPARGLFPEFTGRRQAIRVRALSGGERVTVVQQSRSLVALEAVPLAGAALRANLTGAPTAGVPVGATFLRIGPFHVGATLDVRAVYRGRVEPSGWITSAFYGPASVGAGVALTPGVRPTVGIFVRF